MPEFRTLSGRQFEDDFFAALSAKNIQPKRKLDHEEEEEEDNEKHEKKKKSK